MLSIKETIIVEGVYDKIKLSSFIESPIFITHGFSVFNNKKMQETIRTFAKKTGIVVLTDSDSAGLKIRSFVKQLITEGYALDAFIPEIYGKERRKKVAGKEGLLGVEGITAELILDSLKKSGAEICGIKETPKSIGSITKADFYRLGLTGQTNSDALRKKLLSELSLPSKLSSNMLLQTVNRLLTKNELEEIVRHI